MTTCPAFEADFSSEVGFIEMHPGAHRAAAQAIARAAAQTTDARVYSLIARRAAAIDLEAEFASLASDAEEWAEASFGAAAQDWPTE